MLTDEEIRIHILHKLFRKKKWGAAHIPYDRIKRWITERNIGKDDKRVDENLKKLIKERLILSKPTHYGIEISLNPRFSKEIIDKIKRLYPEL